VIGVGDDTGLLAMMLMIALAFFAKVSTVTLLHARTYCQPTIDVLSFSAVLSILK